VDISDDVRVADGITIRRGQPDESSSPEPGSISLTLANKDGKYSPRNPNSPLYGKIGRNTPVRVRVTGGIAGDPYLLLPSDDGANQATTPDDASLDITGDIDIRIDAALDGWETGAGFAARWDTVGNQRAWGFGVDASGELSLNWSPDGTLASRITAQSTVRAGLRSRVRKALRVTLDVDNGAGGWTVTFYTADTLNGTWAQLGDPATGTGTTSVFASTADLVVGRTGGIGYTPLAGKVFAFQLLDGIDGTAVANPDFTAETLDTASFTDDAGLTWTIEGDARIGDPGVRGVGEVSEFPARWDVSGQDVTVPIVAQGILRRLNQGRSVDRSPFTASTLTSGADSLRGYWPCEDGAAAQSFASPMTGVAPMTWTGDAPTLADVGPLLGSDKVPTLGATTTLTATPLAALDGACVVSWLMDVPAVTGWADNTPIIQIRQSLAGSTVATWEIRYKSGSGGDLQIRALDASGTELAASGTFDFNIDDSTRWWRFSAVPSGSDVSWTLIDRRILDDGTISTGGAVDQVFAGLVVTHTTMVKVAPAGGLADAAIGQLAVSIDQDFGDDWAGDNLNSGLLAFKGEAAATRALRLATEQGLSLLVVGDADSSVAMGPEAVPSTFVDALNETWQADAGLLFETRDQLGLTFRTRKDLYNSLIALTLDYTANGEIDDDLEPTDDDQNVRNRVTVTRKSGDTTGSSATFEDSTSRMGTQSPPDGVGPYEDSVTLNLEDDSNLLNHAAWRVYVGTWDEARYPIVRIDLLALAAQGKWDLIAAICALDFGDRLQLTNLPVWCGADGGTMDLMVLGSTETLGAFSWTIAINCVPYGPYNIGTYESTTNTKRYDTLLTITAEALDTTETGVDITNSGGVQWGTVTPYNIVIGGEEMTVTAVSGTGASQTLTVTRSANDVVKSHSTAAQVRLAPQHRAYRGL
jgi:hypothetical protein